MELNRISSFDFRDGGLTLLPQTRPNKLPKEELSPLFGEAPVLSKLQELFRGNELENLELDSLALPADTLKVLAQETLKSLILDGSSLLSSANGIAPMQEIGFVKEMLLEEVMNHELLAALRRTILGG
ncbi:MAG: hypothetical protein K9M81_00900 [Chthoniobacterales bacterium]|nr:hypothetical protein [Chthoniobacterales bacterium]